MIEAQVSISLSIIKKNYNSETMQHNKIAFYCIFNNYLSYDKYFMQITE